MDRVLKSLFQVHEFHIRRDDDYVDRLNRHVTPTILCMFTVLISIKQYVGTPIDCWCPAQFTSSHRDYTNMACWVSGTYYVPFDNQQPEVWEPRKRISYYQWVPLFLLCQSTLFFIPSILWRFLNRRAGFNLAAVMEAAVSCQRAVYPETREKTIRYMVCQIDSYLTRHNRGYRKTSTCDRFKRTFARYCCLFYGRFYGNYLTFCYISAKVLYIINAVAQLFILDAFLGMQRGYHMYGLDVLSRLLSGDEWTESGLFPRVTLCDFQIRQQVNVHRYTVQCVLPINLFNEKLFIFLWFWLLFIVMITVASCMYWCARLVILRLQLNYVKQQLKGIDFHTVKRDVKALRKFTEHYLRRDGLLIVRLISKNAGSIVAAELLHGLWLSYGPERRVHADYVSGSGPSGAHAGGADVASGGATRSASVSVGDGPGASRSYLAHDLSSGQAQGTMWTRTKDILMSNRA